MLNIFKFFQPDLVINLAAQAGVRHSLKYPEKYLRDNIKGFLNILELSKLYNVKKVIYASSSSIYGRNESPFQEKNNTDKQIQFYAVTKKTNELMAHTWSSLYGIQTIGLRFFTVYGHGVDQIWPCINLLVISAMIKLLNYLIMGIM